jgi:ABC-2 type transport system permease protein
MTQVSSQDTSVPVGKIHDLAYQRYTGRRLGDATRFLVIARYALRMQWRQPMVKLFMLGALLSGAIGAAVVGFTWASSMVLSRVGASAALTDDLLGDAKLAVTWALNAQVFPTFLLILACGAPSISLDLNAGAFQFHFARPVDVTQYLLGRIVSAVTWAAMFSFGTLGLFCVIRLGMFSNFQSVAKLFATGCVGVALRMLTLGSIAIACSSLTRRKGLAQALFVGVVLGTSLVLSIVSQSTRREWLSTVAPFSTTGTICDQLLGVSTLHGVAAFAPSVAAGLWIAASIALARWRVSRAEVVRG